eukprot:TRINITY_DN468_c0_g1_i1.p2 TRINITY_DN468_c0_g1~~TRINITY_DN468_c0_g1_i1.p2  ORF type:complete len:141 (+),score=56.82 TRINITY_DN468_c0_g1_i1:53-424(+)
MPKVKAHELRTKTKTELVGELGKLKEELSSLRVAQVTGGASSKLSNIKVVRKSIARVLTVINQTRKSELRKHYAGAKYKPTDLRYKQTRAIRRRLSKTELAIKTERQKKKLAHFPLRKFAVKA